MVSEISELIQVATKLGEFSEQLKQANTEKRKRMTTYFKTVGECLENIAQQLRKGEIPTKRLGELQVHAEQLSSIIREYLGKEEADKLSVILRKTANNVRNQAPTIVNVSNTKSSNEEIIQLIEEASGRFNGLAITVDYTTSKSKLWLLVLLLIIIGLGSISIGILYLRKINSYQHIIVASDQPSPSSLVSPCSSLSGIYRGKKIWGVLKINYLTASEGTNCFFYADDNKENPYFSHLTTGSLKSHMGDQLLWNITTRRINTSDKCKTEMYGTLTSSRSSKMAKLLYTATDGLCDLNKDYSSTIELLKN